MSDWMSVDAASAIEPGSHRIVETDDVRIAVFNIDGNFFAIEDLCSHDYATLADGDLNGDEIICPLHYASFCLHTGHAKQQPADEDIRTYNVRVTDGVVEIEL